MFLFSSKNVRGMFIAAKAKPSEYRIGRRTDGSLIWIGWTW